MAFDTNKSIFAGAAQRAAIDEGLRAYMLRVYNYMTIGLVVTGFIALLTASSPTAMNAIYGTPLRWLVMLAPLGFVMFLSFGLHRMSFMTAQTVFWAFCAAMGVSLSYIFMVYTGGSIARVFFITAGAFAGLSLFGYTTKKDLSGFGTFLIMGLIGIIIASIVNIFMQSSALHFAISVIGVLVFSGLTAYDTQNIKNEYSEYHNQETAGKLAISGALRLYLDFINLFIMLLHLFGNRN
ncbi:Bax inhibitor-1/YccA family protein [Alphaproteobacteria bacterium]|nr:Bax inhibitor-1/YccA family protein [Alphaproteobacteria bacterium]